jgi:hypothetical protein
MSNDDLASQLGYLHLQAKCAREKAAFLLAELDRAPRDQRAEVVVNVELVCEAEAILDAEGLQSYRDGLGRRLSGAPSSWDDPSDPANR